VNLTPLVKNSKPVVQSIYLAPALDGENVAFLWPNGNGAMISRYATQKLLEGRITFVRCGIVYQCQLEAFAALAGVQSEIEPSNKEEADAEDQ